MPILLRFVAVVSASIATLCASVQAQTDFTTDCISGKTPQSCNSSGLRGWLQSACECAGGNGPAMALNQVPPGSLTNSFTGDGDSSPCSNPASAMSTSDFAAAVCAFFQHCMGELVANGVLPANPTCDDILNFIECSLSIILSPAQKDAILQCLGCTSPPPVRPRDRWRAPDYMPRLRPLRCCRFIL
jgi:hypothetical protein